MWGVWKQGARGVEEVGNKERGVGRLETRIENKERKQIGMFSVEGS